MKKYVKVLAATAVTAFILEALLFNISSLKTLGNRPVVMAASQSLFSLKRRFFSMLLNSCVTADLLYQWGGAAFPSSSPL